MGSPRDRQPAPPDLRGLEVAVTGRLASMSRADAITWITERGGRYVEAPTQKTRILVVGGDGPPLGRDGRPTRSMERAAALQRGGQDLDILDEVTFLARSDHRRREDADRLYTTAQLSRILDVPSTELRGWIRAELIRPVKVVRRLCFFDFPQVANARRLQQLTSAGITPARIRRSLEQLSEWSPGFAPTLSQLESLERRGPLVVRLDDGRLAETNGQLRLDFEGQENQSEAKDLRLEPRQHSSEEWFELGVQAEEAGRFDGAVEAYERALSAGPAQPEVCFNLGNSYYTLGRHIEAAASFIRATELDPDYVEAWNNLGNALAEIGHHDQAVQAYKRALQIEPNYADAHYNLGETLALQNDQHGAARHWVAYLKQDPNSPWAHRIRSRLGELR